MKQQWIYVMVLSALVVWAAAWAGCKSKAEEAPQFYYYPSMNAYYDVAGKRFAYTLNGGKTWQYKQAMAPQVADTLAEKVVITSTIKEPWLHNGEHRMKYNGVASDFEILRTPPPPKPKVVKKNKEPQLTPAERAAKDRREERLKRREARRAKAKEDFERLREVFRRR